MPEQTATVDSPKSSPPYQLAEHEAQIEAALLILGLSFSDIKERGLAEASGYPDFGSYCLDRWRQHSSITERLIHDATVNVLLWPPRAGCTMEIQVDEQGVISTVEHRTS